MVYKLLAARARRLMICSWVKVPEGAVYTQWLRGVQMAWLSQQLGRVVQPEEMRWFFALNTEGEDPEDDLLDWHFDKNKRIRSCWSLGSGAIAFRVRDPDTLQWENAQALSLMHGSVYTMGLTASGNDRGPVRHRTWSAGPDAAAGGEALAGLRWGLFGDWPVGSVLPAATTPLTGLPYNLPMPPAPAESLLALFKSVDFVVRATPGLVWDISVSGHFGGLQSQENRANLGLPAILPWPLDVCMSKDIEEIEQGVHDVCVRGAQKGAQKGGTQYWEGLGTTTMNRVGPMAGTVRTEEQHKQDCSRAGLKAANKRWGTNYQTSLGHALTGVGYRVTLDPPPPPPPKKVRSLTTRDEFQKAVDCLTAVIAEAPSKRPTMSLCERNWWRERASQYARAHLGIMQLPEYAASGPRAWLLKQYKDKKAQLSRIQ